MDWVLRISLRFCIVCAIESGTLWGRWAHEWWIQNGGYFEIQISRPSSFPMKSVYLIQFCRLILNAFQRNIIGLSMVSYVINSRRRFNPNKQVLDTFFVVNMVEVSLAFGSEILARKSIALKWTSCPPKVYIYIYFNEKTGVWHLI